MRSEPVPLRRALSITLSALCVLVVILASNALLVERPSVVEPANASAEIEIDADSLSLRLAQALRFPTISHKDSERVNRAPFEAQRDWLAKTYPHVHDPDLVESYRIGEGQIYILAGSAPQEAPLLLLAHLDVVPVESASREAWSQPPFGGEVAEGFVWGRGAMDDKSSAIAIFEAMELLIGAGENPRRTLIVALGEDEEVLGLRGAACMAEWLEEREIRPFLILDEGMVILEDAFEGVEVPVGLIGVSERGSATLELLATAEGGHSSMPPARSAVFALSRALARIEEQPMDSHVDGVVGSLLDRLSGEQSFARRLVTSNRWLFGGFVAGQMERAPGPNAMLRTTFAPTIVRAGEVTNALPTQARAWVNVRVHPSDTLVDVVAHVREAIADTGVAVSVLDGANEPSPVSPSSGPAWDLLRASLASIEPRAVSAPGIVVGATDARHYSHLSESVYRFVPMRLVPEDLPRIHGVDERIGVENYAELVRFYLELILSA